MRNLRKALFVLPVMLLCSCKTPKNIAYFQDAQNQQTIQLSGEQTFRLRPEDKINIVVNSKDPTLEALFTLTANGQKNTLGASSSPRTIAGKNAASSQQTPIAYTVDSEGNIEFPVLGSLHVGGMTRQEVAKLIQNKLISQSLVNDAIVTVEYVNMGVSVLGEVKSPGRLEITKDHLTVLEAIAQVGDLNITGNRQNVLVMRKENGTEKAYYLDLTNAQSVISSPAYYLQQDDVVYVTPNDKRKRESTAAGNTVLTPSFWISVCSMLVTISALIISVTD